MRRWTLAAALVAVVGLGIGVGIYALRTTGQQEPPGLARATATPDPSSLPDAAAAKEQLTQADPALGNLLSAVAAGDVDGVMALIDWQQQTCGVRRDVTCGGAATGATVDVVNAGWPVPFYVPADVLRRSLAQALAGTPPQWRFASQSNDQPSVYYLGFDGPDIKGQGLPPLADPASNITGIFMTVDVSRPAPIVSIDGTTDQYSATKRGSEIGFEKQRLIVFEPIGAAAGGG